MVKERKKTCYAKAPTGVAKPWSILPTPGRRPRHNRPPYSGLLMVALLFCVFLALIARKRPFWELDENGQRQLAEWRRQKLEKELEKLHNAEQYALIAIQDGFYLCYSCLPDSNIYLYRGEVWKYGVTTVGEKGRYFNGLPIGNLQFTSQFRGNILECLEEEKRKIYFYPNLPENVKRDKPIIRPPGNKQDN